MGGWDYVLDKRILSPGLTTVISNPPSPPTLGGKHVYAVYLNCNHCLIYIVPTTDGLLTTLFKFIYDFLHKFLFIKEDKIYIYTHTTTYISSG